MGATDRPYVHYLDHRPLRVPQAGIAPDRENGFATLIGIAHLALYVFVHESSEHGFGESSARPFGRSGRSTDPRPSRLG
jgi:hypothetical protein